MKPFSPRETDEIENIANKEFFRLTEFAISDLLIEINRDMNWLKDSHVKSQAECLARFNNVDLKANSAHKRIDWITVSVVLAIVFVGFTVWFK